MKYLAIRVFKLLDIWGTFEVLQILWIVRPEDKTKKSSSSIRAALIPACCPNRTGMGRVSWLISFVYYLCPFSGVDGCAKFSVFIYYFFCFLIVLFTFRLSYLFPSYSFFNSFVYLFYFTILYWFCHALTFLKKTILQCLKIDKGKAQTF